MIRVSVSLGNPVSDQDGARITIAGSWKMIDVSLRGVRCRAAQEILDSDSTVGVATEGTIVYELEGEGGQLVSVQWDTGTTCLVSSEEIEITDSSVSWQ
ncbi:MAG TPA: hypothetical protein VF353_11425 [Candidatus Binatia bacterium]|jgi:hypothetical protein